MSIFALYKQYLYNTMDIDSLPQSVGGSDVGLVRRSGVGGMSACSSPKKLGNSSDTSMNSLPNQSPTKPQTTHHIHNDLTTIGTKPNASKESSISVSVRVRPFTEQEERNLIKVENDNIFLGDGSFNDATAKQTFTPLGIRKIVDVVDDRMLIFDPPDTNPLTKLHRNMFPSKPNSRIREHRFVFDKLFDTNASQNQVFESTTKPLIDSILDGFNATVFAYGATGCGKTHTILGTPSDPGIIFLTMQELYKRIEELQDSKIFEVSVSFLEIYNETIKDLLNPGTNHKKLVIREDTNNKVFVSNLSTHQLNSVEEIMELIVIGNGNRTVSPTEANATSSRSHAVLQINVNQRDKSVELSQEHTFATLSIIDLAGSERASATKNRGVRLVEGANINKSLLALGNCINALCDPRRRNHIPYRDSKLTRLLKFSLGGNCKTVMIVCVSPLSHHYDETLNTLKYADRAKEIKTKLIRNQHNLDRHVGSYLKMITQQKQEIDDLKNRQEQMVDNAVQRFKANTDNIIQSIYNDIESLKNSVFNKNQDRWQKYFILAKRKVLLNQKVEMELIQERNNKQNETFMNLIEQVLNKVSLQIQQLETQYSTPTEIDYILDESSLHMLKRLQEQSNWTDNHNKIFQSELEALKSMYERDLLFNSSILYDHLIIEMRLHNFSVSSFSILYENFFNKENFDQVIDSIIKSLEFLVNGDFDSMLEIKSSAFMQNKMRELETKVDFSDNRVSPPLKKLLQKKKASPTRLKINKKVHFMDMSVLDSETSYDESMMAKSDLEDGSLFENSILENDEFYDAPISSPPLSKPTSIAFKKQRPKRVNSLTQKKLDEKLPLLNKEASKLLISEDKRPLRVHSTPTQMLPFGLNMATKNIESNGSDKVE